LVDILILPPFHSSTSEKKERVYAQWATGNDQWSLVNAHCPL
jgi:hypothetical protein